ncbi:MarR family winged helix-turn-helix transcriptional regulator [Brevibacterium epidermidis]|uniref:MarR family winged helix-turn-helix transcriptional regulator n=1 Tax=Brevibacterium epidermidis TaxID=1698 RepID=UPI0007825C7D|nr:MarR family transcriptional regulator [Brevibacterium epidermidis]
MNTLDLDRQLCFALYSASRAMTASYKDLLAELGITYPQYLVMLVLWEEDSEAGAVTVKHLGDRLQLDSGTLSPLLSRLESIGFVSRHRSAEDSRSVFIRPTPEGVAAKERAECVPARIGERTHLDPGAVPKLVETLRTLASNLRSEPGAASSAATTAGPTAGLGSVPAP